MNNKKITPSNVESARSFELEGLPKDNTGGINRMVVLQGVDCNP